MWRNFLSGLCSFVLGSQLQAATAVLLPGAATLRTMDLTAPFHTRDNWQFVIRQDPPQDTSLGTGPGNLHFCFVRGSASHCFGASYPNVSFNALGSSAIEYPTPASHEPVLVVVANDQFSPTGGGRLTLIWAYNPKADQFDQMFDQAVSKNTNGEIRLITTGPLAGDIVKDVAGGRPAYRYHITVYRLENSEFKEVLSYDGNSKYNDGSGLPVIDAEMAEIERRLGLWKPGDPLPAPVRTYCDTLELRHGVEWCR